MSNWDLPAGEREELLRLRKEVRYMAKGMMVITLIWAFGWLLLLTR